MVKGLSLALEFPTDEAGVTTQRYVTNLIVRFPLGKEDPPLLLKKHTGNLSRSHYLIQSASMYRYKSFK